MPFRTLRDIDVKGHRVFLRADLNVPIKEGRIKDATRITSTLATLRHLLDGGASVVLCSHLGRPKGEGFEQEFSMAPVAAFIKEQGIDVRLASGVIGEKVEAEAAALKPGQVLLLENLRFDKGETKNKPEFAQALARLGDTYVDDAFGASHRAHASVSGMVPFMPKGRAVAGFLMEKELKALGRVMHDPEKPLLAVMGGSKVSDKIDIIRHFFGKADTILIGGAMTFTFLKSKGIPIGKSLCEDDKVELAATLLKEAEKAGTRLLLPCDHVAANAIAEDAECEITLDAAVPDGKMGLDIGPETVAAYTAEIRAARTILWNGPMGVFEVEPFASGTLTMAEELANAADRGAFVVVGGGDSVSASNKAGVSKRMSHVSTGGGASLEFLSGLDLPGVAALS
jgi:phosphoglycerate kinase